MKDFCVDLKFVFLKRRITTCPQVAIKEVGYIKKELGKMACVYFIKAAQDVEVPIDHLGCFEINKVGDNFHFKICDRCFKILLTSENFANNRVKSHAKITKRPSCKSCRKHKDGIKIPVDVRKKWEKRRPANYDLFKCPICDKTTIAGISKIVLDHCHKSGAPRGFLCESCNTGIGRFDDDVILVKRALNWLNHKLKPDE